MTVIRNKGKSVDDSKITVEVDNRKVRNGIVRTIRKASQHAQDSGVEIAEMKNVIKSIKFKIKFKLTRIKKDRQYNFKRQTLEALLKECNRKAKDSLEQSSLNARELNVKYVGYAALETKGRIVTNLVKEAM